jgi:alpha-galactosidase
MLSRYVPPQNFQIEFLNNWRNKDKYASEDQFAPKNYSFDYLFAISAMAQPLAWLETSNLPVEAFSTGETIKKYKAIQHDLHKGAIYPIGEEPSGKSWTGFESINPLGGYILVFREDNNRESFQFKTRFTPNRRIILQPIIGYGKAFATKVDADGRISFSLAKRNSFALYKINYR